jgi:hypothetical protein
VLQLSSIREKITWQLVVMVLVYIVAAVFLGAVFLPRRLKSARLEGELEQLSQNEKQLERFLEQRPQLEYRQKELIQNLDSYAKVIPSQHDLQQVLEGIRHVAAQYGLSVSTLSSSPLRMLEGGKVGVVTLSMEIEGRGVLPSFTAHLQELLPSFALDEVSVAYMGGGQFTLNLYGELQVLIADQNAASNFRMPSIESRDLVELPEKAFGLPFQSIAQFLQGQVEVVGIVDAGSYKAALITQGGLGRWLRVGDSIEEAVITDISSGAVWLDMDGVELKLTIGG